MYIHDVFLYAICKQKIWHQHLIYNSLTTALDTIVRDWSLITGKEGEATKREGGHVKFYPYEKGGQKKF